MENEFNLNRITAKWSEKDEDLEIDIVGWAAEFLSKQETIALRDFLNSLDLDEKKDCKDGQHSGDTGKCSECGRTYIHGVK